MEKTIDTFKEEQEQLILDTEEKSKETIEAILDLYIIFLRDAEKEINSFITKYSDKKVIPYSETRKRLVSTERKSFNTQLKSWYTKARDNNMDNEYIQYLKNLGAKKYITRMEYLQANLRNCIENLMEAIKNELKVNCSRIYTYGYYTNLLFLGKTLRLPISIIPLEDSDIKKALDSKVVTTNYKTSLLNNKNKLINDLQTAIPQGIASGFSVKKLVDIINQKTATSRNRAIALTRTETNYLCNKACLENYKKQGIDEYEYIATLDMRTSDMCRDMDGYVGKVSQAEVGVNYPPIHVHCRSTTIPHIENLGVLRDRVARDSEGKTITVSKSMTQEQWIKKYVPKEQQEELLQFKGKYRKKL